MEKYEVGMQTICFLAQALQASNAKTHVPSDGNPLYIFFCLLMNHFEEYTTFTRILINLPYAMEKDLLLKLTYIT